MKKHSAKTHFKTGQLALASLFILLLPGRISGSELRIGRSAGWGLVRTVERTAFRTAAGSGNSIIAGGTITFEEESQQVLTLDEAAYRENVATDLLLHLDRSGEGAGSGYYAERDGAAYPETRRVFGTGAALFRRRGDGIYLMPGENSLFRPGSLWKDFTIEFWLRPQYLEQGETVLLWQSSRQTGERIHPQELRVYISGRGVVWRFDNIFLPAGGVSHSVEVKGRSVLVPEQWHHHSLRFDSGTGMLLYQIDGKDEAVRYITDTEREGGSVFLPYTGGPNPEPLIVGEEYTGYIDELRISTGLVEQPVIASYPLKSGTAETVPIDLGGKHARVVSIETESRTIGMSEIHCFYRQNNSRISLEDPEGGWIPFTPGAPLPVDVSGRYLKLRFELFPDGSGMAAPELSEVRILYQNDDPPVPPSLIGVTAGDGSITLNWNAVSAHDVSGYLVFYGTRPDTYRGTEAAEGESPVRAGKATSLTLTGLENGTIYFFRIAAYDNDDPERPGPLSREVSGRPLRQTGRKGPE